MFNITIWISLPKKLSPNALQNEKVFIKSLAIFENIEAKIEKMRKALINNPDPSLHEIEAYSRSLSNFTPILLKNWQEIVLCSLEAIIKVLEKNISEDYDQKIIRKSISCCDKIIEECKIGDEIKPNYSTNAIEPLLNRIDTLHECFISRRANKILDILS